MYITGFLLLNPPLEGDFPARASATFDNPGGYEHCSTYPCWLMISSGVILTNVLELIMVHDENPVLNQLA